jgi:hypothetical protein
VDVNNPSNKFGLEVLRRLLVKPVEFLPSHPIAAVELDRRADQWDRHRYGGCRGVGDVIRGHVDRFREKNLRRMAAL